jgi:acyl-CoA synthetase (AMP-forming)/AMP-acid ligase II
VTPALADGTQDFPLTLTHVLGRARSVHHDFAYLEEIPKTSVGKFDKKVLREMLAADRLPGRRTAATARKGS